MGRSSALRLVYSPEEIALKVAKLADEISASYGDEPLIAVCVLKGAFIFFADLCRRLHNPGLKLDFIRIASYGSGTAGANLVFGKDMELDAKGYHVLIVEDIIDTGRTMSFLLKELRKRKPLSVRIATLLDKKERREKVVNVDFKCFETPPGFFVGYGLDYAEHYRELPGLYELSFSD